MRDIFVRDGIHLNKRGASIGAHCFLQWNKSNTTSRHNKKNKTKNLRYICFRTGIPLINAAGVVISSGILSCPPVSGCVYAIRIVVIEECQKYFITRSAVIPRTLFWHFAYCHVTFAWSMRPKAAFVPIRFCRFVLWKKTPISLHTLCTSWRLVTHFGDVFNETIIPFALVGYEIGYSQLISNARSWNNC